MATKKRRPRKSKSTANVPVCKFARNPSTAENKTSKRMPNGTYLICPKKKPVKKAAKKARKARRR